MKKDNNIFWINDNNYSDPTFRKKKGMYKINIFKEIGINFSSFCSILDLGCGDGSVSRILYSKEKKIIGIDHSEIAINTSKNIGITNQYNIDYILGDLLNKEIFANINKVECCLAFCVLEHIDEYRIDKVLDSIKSSLSEDGFFLSVHSNTHSIFHIQKSFAEFLGKYKYGYQRDYSSTEISNILMNNGFKLEKVITKPCDGGRKFWSLLDKIVSLFTKQRGRYIFIIAKNEKHV